MRLAREFYTRDVLRVAPELPGKHLVVRPDSGPPLKFMITETEAYRGNEDMACHASRGRTKRTEVMFGVGGLVYVYFVYGMYWMFNVVTSVENDPQAVLIRGIEGFNGPGRLAREIGIDRTYYGEDLTVSSRIWIEDSGLKPVIRSSHRIGVDYAGEYWSTRPWRYLI
ncbi:MAG: DNA-3-methyladenine glycosylase [Bacteroidales bacterium]|nr:DNA-3-methyladenine glycosylase [Bacteroidales bacterium]